MATHNFSGKVIALTGGASGMGRATAKALAARAAIVSIADVQPQKLEEVKSSIEEAGGRVMIAHVDVRDEDQVEKWISDTVAAYGKLDGAANMAGVIGSEATIKPTSEITRKDWDFVLGVNLTGLMHCMRAQIPHMKSPGSIVNAASVSGLVGWENNGAYCASKHGVIGLSRCAAKELGPQNIRVNCFAPGPIDTPMLHQTDDTPRMSFDAVALKRIGKPEEVADLVAYLLSERSSYVNGAVINIDGGWIC